MKNLPLFPTLMAICAIHLAQAQSWCPSEAAWTQSYNTVDWATGYTTEGYITSRYVGDTLIDGHTAQHIQRDLYWREPGASEYTPGTYPPQYTRYENGVVFHWNGQNMLDTLLWFSAVPGDHWFLPGGGNAYQFLVTDTARVPVDGMPLRRLAVSIMQLADQSVLATDTLYERIGLVEGDTFDPLMVAVDGVSTGFLCYRDAMLSYSKPGVEECGFTVSIKKPALATGLRLWPNPGSHVLHIETGCAGRTDVRVLDGMGRPVLVASSPNGPFILDCGSLARGLYLIEVNSAAGRRTERWTKQ